MIEDLDGIIEQRPTLPERWLLPAIGTIAVTAVLVSSFAQQAPLRPTVVGSTVARVSVLRDVGPASGFKTLELPPSIATAQRRTQFSGVTGLTTAGQSDGFGDLYRLADGRLVIVVEYPDPSSALVAPPVDAVEPWHRVAVRGVGGIGYRTASANLAVAIAWWADGTQYVLGGAAVSENELVGLAARLR